MPKEVAPIVAEFIRTMALAWKNLAAYPRGHPALTTSLDLAQHRLEELRGPAGEVVFGIVIDGVVYGDEKIAGGYAHKFANALYTRGVALVRFDTSTTSSDLETFLRLLGVGQRAAEETPIWEALVAAGVVSIHLQPADYSSIGATDTLVAPPLQPPRAKSATLWEEIVRALIAGRDISAGAALPEPHSADELAAMILRYVEGEETEQAFDAKATFGVRFTARVDDHGQASAAVERLSSVIGAYVEDSSGLKKQLVVQQLVQLLRSLPEQIRAAVMRSVVRALATDDSAASLLRDFSTSQRPDEVLDALRYTSTISRLSPHALNLLQAMMPAARPQPQRAAGPTVVADLVKIFEDEDIDRFNPPDHQSLLASTTIAIPEVQNAGEQRLAELGDRVATVAEDAVSRQLARTLIELLSHADASQPLTAVFTRAEMVFRTYVGGWQFADAVELIERLQEIALTTDRPEIREAVHEWFGRLVSAETTNALIESLLEAKPEENTAIQHLFEVLGSEALRGLLATLAEEQNRSRRRRLLDFLTSLGPIIVPEVRRFLNDSRWYVVRNMIVLLRGVGDHTCLSDVRRHAQHADLRVRMEAIRTLAALKQSVPRTLLESAINDPDSKSAEAAIALIGSYGIRDAVDPLVHVLEQRDVVGARKAVRIRAIKALAELADPSVLPRLERYFRDPFLPWPAKDERRAVYESLAAYPVDARQPFVEIGLHSREEDIRQICRDLQAAS